MDEIPHVLVISNTALKRSNSNGDTILSLLSAIPSESIMSFYIQSCMPDKGVASSSFRITDSERLHGFFRGNYPGRLIRDTDIKKEEVSDSRKRSPYRESFLALNVREYIWKRGKWDRKYLYEAIDSFAPDVILFLASRTAFMVDIATDCARHCEIPIIMLTGENEYFRKPKFLNAWDRFLRRRLKRSYRGMMKYVCEMWLTNDKLAKQYQDEFHKPVHVFMPSIAPGDAFAPRLGGKDLIYGGNLEPYRYESLLEISEALLKVAPEEVIHVYSGDVSAKVQRKLDKASNIVLHEPVSKGTLISLLQEAKCVLHFESFSKKAAPLIQNAFSGKMAECLNSGVPFFVYAPDYCAFSSYFLHNPNAVCYASSPNELRTKLEAVLKDESLRASLVDSSHRLAQRYHNESINSSLALQLLKRASLTNE